jgi:AcrR family transcriptional regulator
MARTRRLISDKAFELFTDHGFDRTTIEQIAAAAEVGPRTLYRYYPTKETLVLEFVDKSLFDALDDLRALPLDTPLPAALSVVVARVLREMAGEPERVTAVYELAGQTASLRAQLADLTWRWRDELAAEVAQRLSGPSVGLIATFTAATTMNIIEVVVQEWVDSDLRADLDGLAREALRLFRAGAIPIPS